MRFGHNLSIISTRISRRVFYIL